MEKAAEDGFCCRNEDPVFYNPVQKENLLVDVRNSCAGARFGC